MTEGLKLDNDKPDYSLVPWESVDNVVRVLDFGLKKYSRGNWKHVKGAKFRYFAAAMRHLVAWFSGEAHDKESGLPHLAHAVCCILFLMEFDRTKYPDEEDLLRHFT